MDEPACPGCRELLCRVAALEARVAELTRLLEDALRAGKRQTPHEDGTNNATRIRIRLPQEGGGWSPAHLVSEMEVMIAAIRGQGPGAGRPGLRWKIVSL